jgi:YidC/Oxa1 family membrane protein insertase
MNDTTRIIIAFALIMLVLLGWQVITPKHKPAPVPITTTETTKTINQPAPITQSQIPSINQPVPVTENEAIFENSKFKIIFSSLGGTIKSVYLKKYRAELVPANAHILQTQITSDTSVIKNWAVTYQDESTLVFQNVIKKTYHIHQDYTLSLKLEAIGASMPDYQISYDAGLAMTEVNKKDEYKHFALFYQTPLKANKVPASKIKTPTVTDVSWVGLKSKYFTAVLSNTGKATINMTTLADGRIGYMYKPLDKNSSDYTLYFGPLDYNILKSYKHNWEALNDLGWTKVFSIAILKILLFLYGIFKNYGIVIIVFSIIMKAIFYPLTRMSTKQMQQMQMLQPKIEELKKKYKGDAQALNRETMALYRVYKINPFSGCLPLVFQLPVFWALYAILQKTIELRHAHFAFWIKDLSIKDPIYVLPILMGVSFLIQNFLTTADKRNTALLIFMPIFLTVIFLNFPSGLQLYWLTFNLLSIVESIIARGGIKWKTLKI